MSGWFWPAPAPPPSGSWFSVSDYFSPTPAPTAPEPPKSDEPHGYYTAASLLLSTILVIGLTLSFSLAYIQLGLRHEGEEARDAGAVFLCALVQSAAWASPTHLLLRVGGLVEAFGDGVELLAYYSLWVFTPYAFLYHEAVGVGWGAAGRATEAAVLLALVWVLLHGLGYLLGPPEQILAAGGVFGALVVSAPRGALELLAIAGRDWGAAAAPAAAARANGGGRAAAAASAAAANPVASLLAQPTVTANIGGKRTRRPAAALGVLLAAAVWAAVLLAAAERLLFALRLLHGDGWLAPLPGGGDGASDGGMGGGAFAHPRRVLAAHLVGACLYGHHLVSRAQLLKKEKEEAAEAFPVGGTQGASDGQGAAPNSNNSHPLLRRIGEVQEGHRRRTSSPVVGASNGHELPARNRDSIGSEPTTPPGRLSRAHSSFADHFGGTRLQSQLLWTAALQVQAQALPVALHALGVVPAPLARRCTALPLCEGARWAAAVCVLYLAASARALANAAPLLRSCFDTFGVY